MENQRNGRRRNWALFGGIAMFVLGVGPLLFIIALSALGLSSDPNPNPVGPGILAFLTFWPSLILIVLGVVKASKRKIKNN